MAHFAKLNENNVVLAVHVVNNDIITIDGKESEQAGIDFLTNLYGHNKWKQTSYNGNFRKRFAGINYIYDEELDVFVTPKPHPNWKFNYQEGTWFPPIPYPENNEGFNWFWSQINNEWVKSNTPIVIQ